MRAFTKAAALLSLTHASAFVIPASSTPPANPIIEYQSEEAFLKIDFNTAGSTEQYPTFTFQVEATNKACGESNILLNGLKLDSKWDGLTAHGRDYLDLYGGKEAEWHISCLYDTISADRSNANGGDVVHLLSLRIGSSFDITGHGFTISYQQMDRPAILRFETGYSSLNAEKYPELAKLWRIPSIQFDPEVLENVQNDRSPTTYGSLGQKQKGLGTYLHDLEGSLKKGFKEVVENLCPKHKSKAQQPKSQTGRPLKPPSTLYEDFKSPSIDHHELPPSSPDKTLITPDTSDSTNTLSYIPAAETRSLTSLEASQRSATAMSTPSSNLHTDYDRHLVKVFGLVLVVVICISWICLRCRDPRRRAECLARREERRNKKLYRRAARQRKVKMWVWNFRVRYGLAPSEDHSWDEKRTRVLQQETVLEDAMTDDIRAFRNAHRAVSLITTAEEGRDTLAYDLEGSERSRSVSTLPSYESDSSQPPTYNSVNGGLNEVAVANGFRYNPGETEFRSDSSVISTSPRISRDGTNSDFDEKIEPISLETSAPAGSGMEDCGF